MADAKLVSKWASVTVLGVALVVGACSAANSETTLIHVRDQAAGIEITVTNREPPGIGFKNRSRLRVVTGGKEFATQIDDDMSYGLLEVIWDEPWVLVANDGHVVAGFQVKEQTIFGENQWEKMPYLEKRGGRVLGSVKVGTCALPAGYPRP